MKAKKNRRVRPDNIRPDRLSKIDRAIRIVSMIGAVGEVAAVLAIGGLLAYAIMNGGWPW